jgi:TM2 domain-containing membrane protein YozV
MAVKLSTALIKRLNKWLLPFLCFHVCCAQIDAGFVEHLAQNHLFAEHRAYLNTVRQPADTLFYFRAKFHLQYFNDSLLLENYLKSKVLCNGDSLFMKQAGGRLLQSGRQEVCQTWFASLSSGEESGMMKVYRASENPNLYSPGVFPVELKKPLAAYKKMYNKKPVIGAALSALIPGLGKMYAGKINTGFGTLLLNSIYAVQTAESYQKLGVKHPFTIINTSAFAVFYFANVYGAYHSIIQLRKERKKQFIKDATTYYN